MDAHSSGFKWPLKQEIEMITSDYRYYAIIIDDFMIQGQEQFGYYAEEGIKCSLNYIEDSIKCRSNMPNIFFPKYKEKTSRHHPLRGWCLITNHTDIHFSDDLNDSIFKFDFPQTD